jgi:hypothetical protein
MVKKTNKVDSSSIIVLQKENSSSKPKKTPKQKKNLDTKMEEPLPLNENLNNHDFLSTSIIQEELLSTPSTILNENENENDNDNDNDNDNEYEPLHSFSAEETNDTVVPELFIEEKGKSGIAKKRGRKPKGGKIVQQMVSLLNNKETKPNIILHLKCYLKDIHNDIFTNHPSIESYHFSSGKNELNYEIITNEPPEFTEKSFIMNEIENCTLKEEEENELNDHSHTNHNTETKQLWKKIKQLEYNLHINNISDKKSACFWCTYDFDNPPIYIPKHYIKNSYDVYGCFCSPECATAFLMEENIDSSAKFERYQLLNHIYSKIYEYKKNIKPSPNPYYMLEKYYGNLSIQEYRSLLRNERLFLIVDKPLTRILPELHEDNDDFIINNKIIPSNTVPMKGKLRKKIQSKSNILTEKFGLTQ